MQACLVQDRLCLQYTESKKRKKHKKKKNVVKCRNLPSRISASSVFCFPSRKNDEKIGICSDSAVAVHFMWN